MKYIGKDKHGYSYYYNKKDRYIYQKTPTGKSNGWICSGVVWENGMSKLLIGEYDTVAS